MRASVLIVDDEFGLAELLCELLADLGYEAAIAINGERALCCMSEKRVDLVLLDVMIPIMDGPTTLTRMRDDPRLRAIPVIMMSAFESARPPAGARVQGFLVKPFSIRQLLDAITPLLPDGACEPHG